jgi:hypothetical protein
MAAPAVQIYTNAGKMTIFMDFITGYAAYYLFYDTSPAMGGESSIGYTPNVVDSMYANKSVIFSFTRPVSESNNFYLRLKGVFSSGSTDVGNPGPTKYVPAVSEDLPLYKPVIIEGFDGNVYRPVQVNSAGKLVTTT